MNYLQYVVNAFGRGTLAMLDAITRRRGSVRRTPAGISCDICAGRGAVAALAVAGAIVLAVAPLAGAAYIHKPLFQMAGGIPVEGPHGEHVAVPGPLRKMESMTVDSGRVWVAEGGVLESSRVDEFDAATGAFLAQPIHVEAPSREEQKMPTGYGYGYGEGIAVGHGPGEAAVYVGGEVHGVSVVSVFNEAGALKGTWNGHATPGGSFGVITENEGRLVGTVTAIAVDNSNSPLDLGKGNVLVALGSRGIVDVFHPEADGEERYVGQLTGPFNSPYRIAVDEVNGDLYVIDFDKNGGSVVDVFEPTALGGYEFVRKLGGPPPSGSFGKLGTLAVDGANGEVYVTEESPSARIDEFSAAGSYLGDIENVSGVFSMAVDPASHYIYAEKQVYGADVTVPDVTTNPPAGVKPESVLLSGTVNPAGAGNASCQFEWGTTPSLGRTAPCPAEIANGASPVPVQVTLSGLERGVTYYYRLQASNAGGTNPGEPWQSESFTTPGALLHGESVEDVSATAATLRATINPNQTPTSYYFEYGPSAAYGQRAPAPPGEAIGSGTLDVEPSLRLQGLAPGTVYHYRVVVINEVKAGEVESLGGEDHTFTTQPASAPLVLADGRSWELVSPASKLGALIESFNPGAVQASGAGDAIAYQTSSPTEGEPQGYPAVETVLSTRGAGGWSSRDISPPLAQEAGIQASSGSEFRLFSTDLSQAAVTPVSIGFTPLSPEASESTTYLRTDYPEGNVGAVCDSSCYRPLVTAANTQPGTVFGEEPHGECPWRTCGPRFKGASGDLKHVVLASPVQLTSTPAPVGEGVLEEGPEGVYEWSAGRLQLVGVPPQGEEGPVILAGENPTMIGHQAAGVRHAVSEDGERVILERGEKGGKALYLRDVSAGQTIRLDVPQGGTGPSAGLSYMTAGSDASRIFFLDSGHLTAQSSTSGEDLYEYDLNAPSGSRLSDLTADPNPGEAAGVEAVIGASGDGSYVYFVAGGALREGARPNGLNLYVHHEGATKLIATLANEDAAFFGDHLFARVSPNGRWLAFMSSADLTGYDTRDAISGHRDAEVYLYDTADSRLVCASCDPTGARPVGLQVGGEAGQLVSKGEIGNSWVAANVLPWTQLSENARGGFRTAADTFYQPRYLSDSGRVFFDSADALVPQDVNGTEDVYEFEPVGVGRCDSSSQAFVPHSQGCVGLVSPGTSPVESALVDASESGNDVFFLTQAKLTSQDYDTAYDVYDAHECTSTAPCFPTPAAQPPECETEGSCRAAPAPQPALYGAPASATFSGTGNVLSPATPVARTKVKPKAKKTKAKCAKRKAKGKCVKKAKLGKSKRTTATKSRRGGNR